MEKVLLVDDDPEVLEFAGLALAHAGFETREAMSAAEALKTLGASHIPVVVSDIMMPDMNGLELMVKIKEKFPETLVIFMTANASLDSAIFALKEGAFAYLRKPFAAEELAGAVRGAYTKVRLFENNQRFVNELKEAKEYSESILKTLKHMVIVVSPDGRIHKTNHAVNDLLGYSEAELKAQPVDALFSAAFPEAGWKGLSALHEVKNFPVVFKKKDGSEVPQFLNGTVMKDDDGRVIGFLGTSQKEAQA